MKPWYLVRTFNSSKGKQRNVAGFYHLRAEGLNCFSIWRVSVWGRGGGDWLHPFPLRILRLKGPHPTLQTLVGSNGGGDAVGSHAGPSSQSSESDERAQPCESFWLLRFFFYRKFRWLREIKVWSKRIPLSQNVFSPENSTSSIDWGVGRGGSSLGIMTLRSLGTLGSCDGDGSLASAQSHKPWHLG